MVGTVPLCGLYILYIVLMCCTRCVYKLYIVYTTQLSPNMYIVHSLHDTTCRLLSDPKGDPNGPLFYFCPAGPCYRRLGQELLYVHTVHSTCDTIVTSSSTRKGDPNGPLILTNPAGVFITSTWSRNKSGSPLFFGPRVHL